MTGGVHITCHSEPQAKNLQRNDGGGVAFGIYGMRRIFKADMKLFDRTEYKVESAIMRDALMYEGGSIVVDDECAAVVRVSGINKCVFADAKASEKYADTAFKGLTCVMGVKWECPSMSGADACKTYAYLKPLPPDIGKFDIRRLAPTLDAVIAEKYRNRGNGVTQAEAHELMVNKGVFGAFTDSKFAGFIGRHADGSMGMLTVFDEYRRNGYGGALERFMINYVMTFGRVPFCDVYIDNAPSVALQNAIGMTEADGLTFWKEFSARE